jgi:sugar phosphate isomerase/epimerase
MHTTRRGFLAAAAAAAAVVRAKPFNGPLGLEMYSFRREMERDVPGTLALIHRLGFTEIETGIARGMTAAHYREMLDQAGLKATSYGAGYEQLGSAMSEVQSNARTLGAKWIALTWIPHQGKFTADVANKAVSDMNAWGASLAAAGMRLAYHPHGYEFESSPEGTLFDTMAARTDPAKVFFEMDTFWIAWPGQDCVKLLRQYSGRFRLMHLKDLKKGVTGDMTAHAPEEDNVPIGSGQLDWPAILRTAKEIGVERYYIEDESADPLVEVPESLKYLKSVEL